MKYVKKSDLIQECDLRGIPLNRDFHALSRRKILGLYEMLGESQFQTPRH